MPAILQQSCLKPSISNKQSPLFSSWGGQKQGMQTIIRIWTGSPVWKFEPWGRLPIDLQSADLTAAPEPFGEFCHVL